MTALENPRGQSNDSHDDAPTVPIASGGRALRHEINNKGLRIGDGR